jgi:excisionase family DNA binding protein
VAILPDESSTALLERDEADAIADRVVLLRAVEVARLLGLSRSQIYQMMAGGQLPVVRIGRAVRVPKRALAKWIRTNTVSTSKGVHGS